jgi:hypothetical protein
MSTKTISLELPKLGWIESGITTAGQPDFLSSDRKKNGIVEEGVGSVL